MYQNNLMSFQFPGFRHMPEFSTTTTYTEDAEDLFVDAKEKLLDVNNWKRYSGMAVADFRLIDGHGRPVKRKAHRGDHIKIEMAGQTDHYCMVIDAIEYDDYPDLSMETFTLRLRPCVDDNDTDDESTSVAREGTMVIERRNRKLFASFQEKGDPSESGWFCFTNDQWNSLVKGFIQ